MPRPTILAFNLTDARLAKLRFLCMKLGLLVKPVPQDDYAQPLAALASLVERSTAAEVPETFTEEMIVFCHMTNVQLNQFLQTAKQQRVPAFPLKAILTPTNAEWTPVALCAELKEERAAILSGSQAHQPE